MNAEGKNMGSKLIISGSPRRQGRSTRLSQAIFDHVREQEPDTSIELFSLVDHLVNPCLACDGCKDDFHCVIDDDMQLLYPLLDAADELTIVSPVFFAGPPSQMKAVLDRLQPYYWRYAQGKKREKRPARLFVIGEGKDPHGFEPLIVSTRSALAVARFSLDAVYDCVGLADHEIDQLMSHLEKYRYPYTETHKTASLRQDDRRG